MTVSATATITSAGFEGDPITVLEDALYAWVLIGSGLAADHVIWSDRGRIPAGTYISLRLKGSKTVSDDWVKTEKTADNRIIHHVRGTRNPTLEVSCFAGPATGANRCEATLNRVIASARFPDVAAGLKAGDVGLGPIGPIRTVDGVRSQMFDPRAIVEITLHTMIDVARSGFAIESVATTVQTDVGSTSGVVETP